MTIRSRMGSALSSRRSVEGTTGGFSRSALKSLYERIKRTTGCDLDCGPKS